MKKKIIRIKLAIQKADVDFIYKEIHVLLVLSPYKLLTNTCYRNN